MAPVIVLIPRLESGLAAAGIGAPGIGAAVIERRGFNATARVHLGFVAVPVQEVHELVPWTGDKDAGQEQDRS